MVKEKVTNAHNGLGVNIFRSGNLKNEEIKLDGIVGEALVSKISDLSSSSDTFSDSSEAKPKRSKI